MENNLLQAERAFQSGLTHQNFSKLLRTCGVNHASRRTSKRSIAVQIQASAEATVFSSSLARSRHWSSPKTAERTLAMPKNKSYVPDRIRNAVRDEVANLKDLHRGPRQAKLNGAYIRRDYSDIGPGDVFSADDVTLNSYYWEHGPEGPVAMRGQFILFVDVRTSLILSYALHSERNYNARVIRNAFITAHDRVGFPRKGLFLERGIWKTARLLKGRVPNEITLQETEMGLRDFVQFSHANLPRAKQIENIIGKLQDMLDGEVGDVGRAEMSDKFERIQKKLLEAARGKIKYSSFLYSKEQWVAKLDAYCHKYNSERQHGRLKGFFPLAARRCKVAMLPQHRALCYFIQQLSHREGGLKRVVLEMIQALPERFQTSGMKRLGVKRRQRLTKEDCAKLKEDFPFTRYYPYSDFLQDADDGTVIMPVLAESSDELFDHCKQAASEELEQLLRVICLDPQADLEQTPFRYRPPGRTHDHLSSVWWSDDIIETIELFRQQHIQSAKALIAETTFTRLVYEAIDTASKCKGLAVVEGWQRTGKTTAAENYCNTHPGETVYISLEPGNDDTSFFRSIARAIGTSATVQLKAHELRGKIQDMLQAGHLTVVFDEAHYLVPNVPKPKTTPKRLDWIRSVLLDKDVPVVLISTPQFDRQCEHYEKHLSWNSKQLRGRLYWQELLPTELPAQEVFDVARKIAPTASRATVALLAAYAVDSTEYLFGINRVVKLARIAAERDGRTVATGKDIEAVLEKIAPGKLSIGKPHDSDPRQTPRKRSTDAVQAGSNTFAEEAPVALARRAGLDSLASQDADFGAGERLQSIGSADPE